MRQPFTVFCLCSSCYGLLFTQKHHTRFSFTPEIHDLFQMEMEELLYIQKTNRKQGSYCFYKHAWLQCTYLVRTIETASLRILSPKTNMLSTGSTLRALKMAIVATGSTADIKEPNAKLGEHKRGNQMKEKYLPSNLHEQQ